MFFSDICFIFRQAQINCMFLYNNNLYNLSNVYLSKNGSF